MNDLIVNNQKVQDLYSEIANAVELKAVVVLCFKIGMVIAVLLVEKILMERARALNVLESPICPECGTPLESKGWPSRKVRTIVGTVEWKRKVWRCGKGCKIGQIAPFDKELGLKPNQRTGDEIKEMVCCLAVFLPFDIAVLLMKTLTGIQVSSTCAWNWVQVAGAEAKARLERELEELKDKLPDAEMLSKEIEKMVLAMGADGVMAPFRPNGGHPGGKTVWKEIKVGIFARLGNCLTKKGKQISFIARKRVVAVLGTVDDLKQRMRLTSIKEGMLEAETVVWLSDGGRGLWGVYYDAFSDHAQGVLDYYHAAQNIWKTARKWFDGRTSKAREWFKSARKRLRFGRGQGVINEINMALNTNSFEDSVRKSLENLVNYLTSHKDHIDYETYKALGIPIGSGMVESTCKWLIQQRFKGVGMRWSEKGFNNLLHLRLAWVNGTYSELFNPIGSPK